MSFLAQEVDCLRELDKHIKLELWNLKKNISRAMLGNFVVLGAL